MLTLAVGCLQRISNWRRAYSLPRRRGQGTTAIVKKWLKGSCCRGRWEHRRALSEEHSGLTVGCSQSLSVATGPGAAAGLSAHACAWVSARGTTEAPQPLLPGKTGAGSPAAGGSGRTARHGSSWPAVSMVAPVCGGCRRGLAELPAAAVARAMQAGPGHGPCPCSTALCAPATHWGTVVRGCRAVPGVLDTTSVHWKHLGTPGTAPALTVNASTGGFAALGPPTVSEPACGASSSLVKAVPPLEVCSCSV